MPETPTWRKSTRCKTGTCVEVTVTDVPRSDPLEATDG